MQLTFQFSDCSFTWRFLYDKNMNFKNCTRCVISVFDPQVFRPIKVVPCKQEPKIQLGLFESQGPRAWGSEHEQHTHQLLRIDSFWYWLHLIFYLPLSLHKVILGLFSYVQQVVSLSLLWCVHCRGTGVAADSVSTRVSWGRRLVPCQAPRVTRFSGRAGYFSMSTHNYRRSGSAQKPQVNNTWKKHFC